MPFTIQNRIHRSQPNAVGIRMNDFRDALARATEAASIVPYHAAAATMTNATSFVGITPAVGAIAAGVYVSLKTGATGTGTVDILADGVSILTAPIDLDGKAAGTHAGTLTAAAKVGIAAGARIEIVTTTGSATLVGIGIHLKSVHNKA